MKTRRPKAHFQHWAHLHVSVNCLDIVLTFALSLFGDRPGVCVLGASRVHDHALKQSAIHAALRPHDGLALHWCEHGALPPQARSGTSRSTVHTQMRIACAPRLPKLTCSRCESWACSSHRPCLTWQLQLRPLNEKLKGSLRRLPSAEQSRGLSSRLTWLDWATIRILPQNKWRTLHSEH